MLETKKGKTEEESACLTDDEMKRIKRNNHPVDTEEEVRRLEAKILDRTRRYEAAEAINLDQNIQLENKELELKTILSEFRTRLEDKLEEINTVKDEVNYLQGK